MKTTTHTPGPWKYSYTVLENQESYYAIIGTPINGEEHLPHKGGFIAKVTGVKARQEANARLIAAAPDLLAALEFLLSDLNSTIDCEARIIAMDAIKAAKGK